MIRNYLVLSLGFFLFLPGPLMAETVSLPLTIDYPLLRALVVHQAFTQPNETATVLDEKDGCNRVTLSQPTFKEEASRIRVEARVHIQLGKPMGDYCVMPMEWAGYLVFHQRPRLDPASWALSFETLDSTVYDLNRQPAHISQALLNVVSADVHDYLDGIRIDLAPPVAGLKSVVSQFFQPAANDRALNMLQTIRSGSVRVAARAVEIEILMDVERPDAKGDDGPEAPLPEAARERFFDQWEAWDSFLVHMLGILAPEPLSSDERQVLLDTLLETRHRFVDGLSTNDLASDFVREQFVAAWTSTAPVFRRHLADRPSSALMGYLAFFTASDALTALDAVGPALGIEISRNGLLRLVRLMGDRESEGAPDPLTYRGGINSTLRDVLDLGPPPPALGPAFEADGIDLTDRRESQVDTRSVADAIGSFFCSPAWATQKKSSDALAEIKAWLFSRDNLESYIDRIRALLMDSARAALKKHKDAHAYSGWFPSMVVATAWQESCFRQFLVKQKKVVYLRSYNGSSVGLMQINERVWRGIYDPQHLRWDIRYNALAGCEIIDLYVRKYLAKQADHRQATATLKDDARAGILYAMYNGGPGQLDKYLSRRAKGSLYDSDTLFLEKYGWVKNGQLTNIDKCLIGR